MVELLATDLENDLEPDPRCRWACGDADEAEALFGVCDEVEEKSQAIECFSQLEHRGFCSSH